MEGGIVPRLQRGGEFIWVRFLGPPLDDSGQPKLSHGGPSALKRGRCWIADTEAFARGQGAPYSASQKNGGGQMQRAECRPLRRKKLGRRHVFAVGG
jgi:hypothetical protein